MIFPPDYPYSPPNFRFTTAIYHPNVYKDGRLCISILHRGGDETSGELDGETWSPAQTVETVLISIVSLLSDPNISSPANVDAAVAWNKDRKRFNERVLQEVEKSKANIPEGFVMPTNDAYVAPKPNNSNEDVVDDDFWYESEDSLGDDQMDMSDDYEEEEEEDYEEDEDEEEEEEDQGEEVRKA